MTFRLVLAALAAMLAQTGGIVTPARDHAAIEYSTRTTTDPVAGANQKMQGGRLQLAFEHPGGYLRSVLTAFGIPVSSQTLVFSENSLQRQHISRANPRAIYFNDTVAVGVTPGADALEIAAQDPAQGVIFYTLAQAPAPNPQFVRGSQCLQCHLTAETRGVPGLFVMSVLPLSDDRNDYARGWATDHRTPIGDRWGGWYVTGQQVPAVHLGNVPVYHVPQSYVRAPVAPKLTTGEGAFDTSRYLSPHSDVVALLVLNHQVQVTNLLTRLGWETRIAAHDQQSAAPAAPDDRIREAVNELVDYMLFVDEAALPSPIVGSATFTRDFPSQGPRDSKGRSLRDLDLTSRLFKYPCSYMIYTAAFDALPPAARSSVYRRLSDILAGNETGAVYARLSPADRRAIIEILRETKPGLPDYF